MNETLRRPCPGRGAYSPITGEMTAYYTKQHEVSAKTQSGNHEGTVHSATDEKERRSREAAQERYFFFLVVKYMSDLPF